MPAASIYYCLIKTVFVYVFDHFIIEYSQVKQSLMIFLFIILKAINAFRML